MRLYSHINAALKILDLHKPGMPLVHTLKQYFAVNKKHGSRDRKIISSLCYCYLRTGRNFIDDKEDKLVRSLYICDAKTYSASGDERFRIHDDPDERCSIAGLDKTLLFPFEQLISDRLSAKEFALSMLVQPDLFLRIRPGKTDKVTTALMQAGIEFEKEGRALRLANNAALPKEIKPDRDAMVQDLNSQKVFDNLPEFKHHLNIWDCCAASGGKSILVYDRLNAGCTLTVTDIRPSIISNLKERFARAGIQQYKSEVLNAAEKNPAEKFDLVICDVPCSGSGTWGRTPEQGFYFKEGQVEEYALLQKSIVVNAAQGLKPGAFLVYITCSVFKRENEDVVDHIKHHTGLQLMHEGYLEGYRIKADTMYAAVFRLS